VRGKVRNLSAGGMRVEDEFEVERGNRMTAELRNVGKVKGTVAWVQGSRIGVAFDAEIDPKLARAPVGTKGSEIPSFARPALDASKFDDPNRSFRGEGQIEEAASLMRWMAARGDDLLVHLDLHETTDSDLHEFDPARCARDGIALVPDIIPDGFYVIGNSEDPQPAFQQALIAAVEKITHIAPADANGELIGMPLQSPGVVWGESRSIGACAGFTDALYATTTEVYPDSPRTSPRECNAAQVTAVCAGLDYALADR
ncbi:MAG: PilZ domain-containing protein, partial [Gammaproteobacteria bacterium]|nr:PilZ domain-containing protein [Gammaproteobacteria bacterium]